MITRILVAIVLMVQMTTSYAARNEMDGDYISLKDFRNSIKLRKDKVGISQDDKTFLDGKHVFASGDTSKDAIREIYQIQNHIRQEIFLLVLIPESMDQILNGCLTWNGANFNHFLLQYCTHCGEHGFPSTKKSCITGSAQMLYKAITAAVRKSNNQTAKKLIEAKGEWLLEQLLIAEADLEAYNRILGIDEQISSRATGGKRTREATDIGLEYLPKLPGGGFVGLTCLDVQRLWGVGRRLPLGSGLILTGEAVPFYCDYKKYERGRNIKTELEAFTGSNTETEKIELDDGAISKYGFTPGIPIRLEYEGKQYWVPLIQASKTDLVPSPLIISHILLAKHMPLRKKITTATLNGLFEPNFFTCTEETRTEIAIGRVLDSIMNGLSKKRGGFDNLTDQWQAYGFDVKEISDEEQDQLDREKERAQIQQRLSDNEEEIINIISGSREPLLIAKHLGSELNNLTGLSMPFGKNNEPDLNVLKRMLALMRVSLPSGLSAIIEAASSSARAQYETWITQVANGLLDGQLRTKCPDEKITAELLMRTINDWAKAYLGLYVDTAVLSTKHYPADYLKFLDVMGLTIEKKYEDILEKAAQEQAEKQKSKK
ncbi:MAG: hypothetical protein LBF56_01450 [Holosporales bacterium]|nr:hypothetical protein [Holosporales bacterium]